MISSIYQVKKKRESNYNLVVVYELEPIQLLIKFRN
jgi:hypothetical protein